ncbi:MAG: glycosyltransferase family 4 protein [Candidatus Cloacimonetes bacterium]|nr:glycosyltransferase family 4 protein [Candidatus Cloacimonadota bacterium]
MKILYISQYFHPEIGATTNRALANVRYLTKQGHDVTVLTEMPNHPKGIIFEGYKGKMFMTETMEDFKIKRVWVYTSVNKNFITRLLFYISFAFLGTLSAIFSWKKYDIVYVTSPPLFVGIIGLALKFFFPKTKFIFEVRDLWPDAAVEMGELKNKHFRKFSYALEKSLYKNADHIVAVTKRFKQRIIENGYSKNKISVIRNGSDLSFKPVDVSEELKEKFQVDKNFIVIYAGNLGLAQNLTVVLKAAEKLKEKKILFLMVGTGPEETLLKNYAKSHNLTNVIFTGEIAKDNMSEYLSLSDCGLIPLKNIEVFERTIPSKLFDYMSANLPIILGVKGEAKEILEKSEAGICFEPDNVDELVEEIEYLKTNSLELEKMKQKGRDFVKTNFDRNELAKKLDDVFAKLFIK